MKSIFLKFLQLFNCQKSKESKLRLCKYNSKLYIECATLLLENGFTQAGDYCFIKDYNGKPQLGQTKFFLYHFWTDGLCLNTYYPKKDSILIKNKEDMQKQINSLPR